MQQAHAIHDLPAAIAAQHYPVRLRAVLTFYDPLDGKLVQIEAELVGRDSTSSDATLVLRANGVLFSVILPRDLSPALPAQWKDGSLLRITGICSTQVNTESIGIDDGIVRPEAVKILLRAPTKTSWCFERLHGGRQDTRGKHSLRL